MPKATKRRSDKPYVLTPKDASGLLVATHDYVHNPDRTITGKDRADVLAEATLSQGLSDLSSAISAVHDCVMRFHKGDYKAIQYLLEDPTISESIPKYANRTRFATAAKRMVTPLHGIAELQKKVKGRSIDWPASSNVLLDVKSEKFPENLTMVEKLAVAKAATK